MFGEIAQKIKTSLFRPSGPAASSGLVPSPSLVSGTQNYLREDATWSIPPNDLAVCYGRLTITSGDPLNTADTVSNTTLYFTPFRGKTIGLYDGVSAWKVYTFSELSIAVPGSSGVYDVFVYDNSGTLTLQTVAWTNNTTRATAIDLQDGIYVKHGDTAKRYLGTIYSVTGGVYDRPVDRNIWNYYNRTKKNVQANNPGAPGNTYVYGTAVWRYWNNDPSWRLNVVCGVSEEKIDLRMQNMMASVSVPAVVAIGVGYDGGTSSNTIISPDGCTSQTMTPVGQYGFCNAFAVHRTGIGYHFYSCLEISFGNNANFYTYQLSVANLGITGFYYC